MVCSAEELRAQLERILASAAFHGAARQQDFLRFVVEELIAGRGDGVKETLIASAVYDKPAGYDPRVDSTVRVEASKMRQRLARYYAESSDPLVIEIPRGTYQPSVHWRGVSASRPDPPPTPRSRKWGLVPLGAALVLVALAWRGTRADAPAFWQVRQISSPAGFSEAPALSPAGDFVVYSSSRESDGAVNLWRQNWSGGAALRLTSAPAHHRDASVSGGQIVFRTAEQGGALAMARADRLETPTVLPGTAGGRNPRFSPRHPAFVYWTPADAGTLDYGRVFLATPEGEQVRLFGDFAHAAYPQWSENGSHVLAIGTWQPNVAEKEFDAWLLELDGFQPKGLPRKTGLFPLLRRAGFYRNPQERARVRLFDWRAGWLYLAALAGESTDLFRIRLNVEGVLGGEFQRITTGAGEVQSASFARDGRMVFARLEASFDLHSINGSGGDLLRHTAETGLNLRAVVDPAGGRLAWEHRPGAGLPELRLIDLKTHEGRALAAGAVRSHAVFSPDGAALAFRSAEGDEKVPIDKLSIASGARERLCDDCGPPSDWTGDGRYLLFADGSQSTGIDVLDTVRRERHPLLKHRSQSLGGARARLNAQGDGVVAFHAQTGRTTWQIFTASVRALRAAPPAEWNAITDGAHWSRSPAWSTDGRTLYWVARGEQGSVIMARAMAVQGQPAGPAARVREFLSPAQTLMESVPHRGADALWFAKGRIWFMLEQTRSSVWAATQAAP